MIGIQNMRGSIQSYQRVSIESELTNASPHRIIQMMYTGAIENILQSRLALNSNDFAKKGMHISKAIAIISALNNCLDFEKGGEIATNLSQLYDFILCSLSKANLDNDEQLLSDSIGVLTNIKDGWEQIPQDKHFITAIEDS